MTRGLRIYKRALIAWWVMTGIVVLVYACGCSSLRHVEVESVYPTFADPTEPTTFWGAKVRLK